MRDVGIFSQLLLKNKENPNELPLDDVMNHLSCFLNSQYTRNIKNQKKEENIILTYAYFVALLASVYCDQIYLFHENKIKLIRVIDWVMYIEEMRNITLNKSKLIKASIAIVHRLEHLSLSDDKKIVQLDQLFTVFKTWRDRTTIQPLRKLDRSLEKLYQSLLSPEHSKARTSFIQTGAVLGMCSLACMIIAFAFTSMLYLVVGISLLFAVIISVTVAGVMRIAQKPNKQTIGKCTYFFHSSTTSEESVSDSSSSQHSLTS